MDKQGKEPEPAKIKSGDVKPKKRLWCCILPAVIVVLAVAALITYQFIPQDYSKQAPARGYQLPAPSVEAQNRQLSCQDFPVFKNNPGKYNPLCLNLYKATADEINAASSGGRYNIILLYGQGSTFRISVPTTIRNVDDLGASLIRVAKFNDLVTMPKMMDWYGVDDLSFIPKQFSPYPAINYTFADQEEVKKLCTAYVAGCAKSSFELVLKDSFLAPTKNWGERITKDNGDEMTREYEWPSDCYAITTAMHETGHDFLVANKIKISGMTTSGWLRAPSYFNENLTEIFTMLFPNEVCGAGTVKVTSYKVGGVSTRGDIVDFSGIYPPAAIHPTSFPKDNACEQAIISSYSHYLLKGDYKTQFKNFVVAFRQAMKENDYDAFKNDKKMATFMLKMLGNDPAEKEFLNSHTCGI